MASIVGSEVEIQEMENIQIQEVEVEPIPVEMPTETVETSVDDTIEVQQMIALQPLPEPAQEEVVLQSSDDHVVIGNPNFVYVDDIPVPAPEIDVYTDDTSPSTSRKGKGGKRKAAKSAGMRNKGQVIETSMGEYTLIDPSSLGATNRKWEQKQVQIKTLEGEFSVTMWATAGDDIKKEPLVGPEEEVTTTISQAADADFTEYMTGKKLPPEGIPGVDLSDPKQLAEFAK
ncbi:hypothetical protein LSH36_43g08017 [Paralvinella palmiformis]|uniref:Uncharacterized protein n=1 Tax=Paralvinella palmiformis TaxID=53620 RepID=A0AAD9K8P2_9ANNE|nr:hypothetical protein LSH36_43g08017 [Paralvinella palmiformis]